MDDHATHQDIKVAAYGWLRWPSILMGSVGIWGILNAKLKMVAEFSELFKLPPLLHCYAITAGAVILFSIAIFYRQDKETKLHETTGRYQWRGH